MVTCWWLTMDSFNHLHLHQDNLRRRNKFYLSVANLWSLSSEITLCLVRQSFSWAPSERLAVTLGWRLFLPVWCWHSELLSQLGPAGGERDHIVAKTSKLNMCFPTPETAVGHLANTTYIGLLKWLHTYIEKHHFTTLLLITADQTCTKNPRAAHSGPVDKSTSRFPPWVINWISTLTRCIQVSV